MKNLYPKGKGKIHPSPGSPSGSSAEALAVLKLLPAAILALTAVLGSEDKEVLAYLITRSMNGPASASQVTGDERRRCRRLAGGVHHAVLDCGCFDCYTSFWFRWDCSPDRELIHHAIEAFEEHLASLERKIGGGGKGRRRERNRSEKGKKCDEKAENTVAMATEEESAVVEESLAIDSVGGGGYCVKVMSEEIRCDEIEEAAALADEEEEIEPPEEVEMIGGERRRGWPDLIFIFNSRLFNLWSPGS